jgi:uncharacterized protein YkwD
VLIKKWIVANGKGSARRGAATGFPYVVFLLATFPFAGEIPTALAMSQTIAASASQSTRFDPAGEAQLVDLINQARSEHGLQPLMVDERLTRAARKHSELMAQHSGLSHQFEGEPPPQTRLADEGLPSDRESENVALNNHSIASAHEGLMNSPPHRQSILDPDYNVVGVGVVRDGDTIYVTEDFARKLPELSEPQAEASAQAAVEKYARSRGFRAPQRKPQVQLRSLACSMARNDALDSRDAMRLTGAHDVLAWTASDPAKLPKGISQVLSPQVAVYSVGACFAPSVRHPSGVYWMILVTYLN